MSRLSNSPRGHTSFTLEARKSFAFGMKFRTTRRVPIDLADADLRLVVRYPKHKGGAEALVKDGVLVDAALGLARFDLQAGDLDLPEGEYPIAVTLVSPLGYSTLILKGSFDVQDNADEEYSGTFPGINPATNISVALEEGNLVSVTVDNLDGMSAVTAERITEFTEQVEQQLGQATLDLEEIRDAAAGQADVAADQADVATIAAQASAASSTAAAASAQVAATVALSEASTALTTALQNEGSLLGAGLRAVVADDAQDSSTVIGAALTATIATQAAPIAATAAKAVVAATAAPARPHPLLGFWAALAQRDTSPVDIVTCGDSIFEGHSATTLAKRNVSRMLTGLRARLGVTGGGVGFIPARYGAPDRAATDGWTTTGRTADNSYGFGKRSRTLLVDGGTGLGDGTMSRTITCTSFKLLVHAHATQATSLFVSVDGGADQTWNIPAGTTSLTAEWSSGALAAGNHTVQVKARSNSAAYFCGVMVFNGDESSGIRLWDAALSGTRADQYNAESDPNNALWANSFAHLSPDLVIIEWITNDAVARTSTQYEASIRNVIALVRSKAANVPILLLAPYERGGTTLVEPWANYTARLAKIAGDTAHVAFLDLSAPIPKPYGNDIYGLLSDGTHPTDKCHALIGDLLAGYLAPRAV